MKILINKKKRNTYLQIIIVSLTLKNSNKKVDSFLLVPITSYIFGFSDLIMKNEKVSSHKHVNF